MLVCIFPKNTVSIFYLHTTKHSISGMLKKQEDADFVKRILEMSGRVTQSWQTQLFKNPIAKLTVTQEHDFVAVNTCSDKPMQIMPSQNTRICRATRGNFYLYVSLKLSPKETQILTHLLCKISEKSKLCALLSQQETFTVTAVFECPSLSSELLRLCNWCLRT